MTRRFAALIFLLIALPALAQEAPFAPFQAEYALLRNGERIGVAHIALALDEDGWHFSTQSEGTEGLAGLAGAQIAEHSIFRWRNGRPETIQYRYSQKVAFRERNRSIDIDHDQRRVMTNDDRGTALLEYAPGIVDRNLVVLAIATDLKANRNEFEYRVADKREITRHRYRFVGQRAIATTRGRIACLEIERVREKVGRTTTLWIAPELGYIPVRILQIEPDGETLEMLLR